MIRCAALLFGIVYAQTASAQLMTDDQGRRAYVPAVRAWSEETVTVSRGWWIFFRDKNVPASAERPRSGPATWEVPETRPAGGSGDLLDRAVSSIYIERVRDAGAKLRTVSRWLNAVSVEVDPEGLADIRMLACVAGTLPVTRGRRITTPVPPPTVSTSVTTPTGYPLAYGPSLMQLLPLGVPELHALGLDGSEVLIAVLDTGFKLQHEALEDLANSGRILETRDFVHGDDTVADDSLDVSGQDHHGTQVLGALAGHRPGVLLGPAYGARFILAKTEDIASETPVEEDHYVAALEWADSLGARIVTSSLSYDFGYVLDGTDGITTIAANTAAARGMLLCTAMGNEGPLASTLGAPADAFDIVAVGAVDAFGQIALFSSRGPTADGRIKPEVCAPGVGVYTLNPATMTAYEAVSGTSFATPLTAASAALLFHAHPDWSPLMVREALLKSGDRGSEPDNTYGHGVFRLLAALDSRPQGALDARLIDPIDRYDFEDWNIALRTQATGDRRAVTVRMEAEYEPTGTDTLWMSSSGDTVWTANLPYRGESGIRLRFTVTDSAGRTSLWPPVQARAFEGARRPDSLTEGFEFGGLRWMRGGTGEAWKVTAGEAAAGRFALTDSPAGPYGPGFDAWIAMRQGLMISMPGAHHLTLCHRYQFGSGDTGYVETRLHPDHEWETRAALTGARADWHDTSFAFPSSTGDAIQVRFRLKSDHQAEGDGWFIDGLVLGPATATVSESGPLRPISIRLFANRPNPFNAGTIIDFELDAPSDVRLIVFDLLGRRIRGLQRGLLPAGRHRAYWDGTDAEGRSMASGVYFCRLSTGDATTTRKMMLLQ